MRSIVAAAWLGLLIVACASPRTVPDPLGSVPGFDTSRYPGEDALRTWRTTSPYRWVGFYLQAPCRRDTSWNGKRATIESMGWGTAVVYVGEQAWEASEARDSGATPQACSRSLLSATRGERDAADAISRTLAEGFAQGTTIYLDIERMSTIPDSMRAYYRAWAAGVWRDGRFRPGVYAHRVNAADIQRDLDAVRATIPGASVPRWWITGGSAFDLGSSPGQSGVAFANVWQGRLNARETYGGVSLDVDANVADRPSPSAP